MMIPILLPMAALAVFGEQQSSWNNTNCQSPSEPGCERCCGETVPVAAGAQQDVAAALKRRLRLAAGAPSPPPPVATTAAATTASPPTPLIFYGPMPFAKAETIRGDFYAQIDGGGTAASWQSLYTRTHTFKLFLGLLYTAGAPGVPAGMGSTDAELKGLIQLLKRGGIQTGIEIGGARWGAQTMCNLSSVLQYAEYEQGIVSRWLRLGGEVRQKVESRN